MRRSRSNPNLQHINSASATRLNQLEGGASKTTSDIYSSINRNQRRITLTKGVTSYSLMGPSLDLGARGIVVCIHGLTLASYVFVDIASALVKANWQVLTFDLYGRGASACTAPPSTVKYDDSFYVAQLEELLRRLKLWDLPPGRKLGFIGASLGGGVAMAFCKRHASRIDSMVLVAPAGLMDKNALPLVARLHTYGCPGRLLQFVLERCCGSCVEQFLTDSFKYSRWAEYLEEDVKKNERFVAGYWNTLKHFPFCSQAPLYKMVGLASDCPPILLLWGENDAVVPFSTSTQVMQYLPNATLVSWPDVGHEITVAEGGKLVSSWINQAVLDFFAHTKIQTNMHKTTPRKMS